MKTGVIYLKIRLQLEQDISEKEAQELVEDLGYEITDEKKRVANTEIVSFETTPDN